MTFGYFCNIVKIIFNFYLNMKNTILLWCKYWRVQIKPQTLEFNISSTTSLNDIINQSLVLVSPISTYLCSSEMNSLLTEWHNSYKSIAFAWLSWPLCLFCRMCCFSLVLSSRARFSGLWLGRLKPTTFLRFAVVAHWTKRLKKAFSQTVKSALGTWLTQPVVEWFS